MEKIIEIPVDRIVERIIEKPVERIVEKIIEKPFERIIRVPANEDQRYPGYFQGKYKIQYFIG